MPRVTISIVAPDSDRNGDYVSLDLAPSLSIADLKGFVTAETGFSPGQQLYYYNNACLTDDQQTIEQIGIRNEGMLAMVVVRQSQAGAGAGPPPRAAQRQPREPRGGGDSSSRNNANPNSYSGSRPPPRGDPEEIEATRQRILSSPATRADIVQMRPALAAVVEDPVRFREVWMEMLRAEERKDAERQEELRSLNDDPFNVDNQLKIEEMIRQQSVQENLQFAYEHSPEVFGKVTMLYIHVEVNKHPVKAFVDSGAQTTIMSPSCAEACGIMRLIDRRYSGIAKGVGTAQILGRVHSADLRIGTATMSCSFTVMEGKDVDLLLGLDMLKRFQAVIDLRSNKLVFGDGNEVGFLGEADIPKYMDDAMQNEPTITGPNGTEIGTQSGTVKPAGASAAAGASLSAGTSARSGPNSGGGGPAPRGALPPGPETRSTPAATAGASGGSGAAAQPQSPESIDQLVSLGFSHDEAVAALEATGGNVEYAAGLLFQG